jgi:serine protease DegQ
MEALISGGAVRRGWIGIEPRDLSAELAESLALPVKSGVLITGVLQSGPAAKGGLRPGDVVLKVGDKMVANTGELFAAVAALKPNTTAVVIVQRGAERVEVKLQVGERPKAGRQEGQGQERGQDQERVPTPGGR